MKHHDLIWWSYLFQWTSLGTALVMCLSIMPPIDGSGSRFPLTIYLGIAAVVLAVLSVATFAAHVIRHRREAASEGSGMKTRVFIGGVEIPNAVSFAVTLDPARVWPGPPIHHSWSWSGESETSSDVIDVDGVVVNEPLAIEGGDD